jgi:uncharacterized protein YciI
MFVVIYTLGPAWQSGKTVTEQPFFREHISYMQQVFAAKQLLMGGPFLDSVGALAILDIASFAQAREIAAHDPFVLARVIEPHLHPWHAYFNQYQARSTQERQANAKELIGREGGQEPEEKRSPTDAEKD